MWSCQEDTSDLKASPNVYETSECSYYICEVGFIRRAPDVICKEAGPNPKFGTLCSILVTQLWRHGAGESLYCGAVLLFLTAV